jgi:hypothetical protein
MKYISIFFVVLSFIIINDKINACDCPIGWDSHSINYNYPTDPIHFPDIYCPVTIEYCCHWDNNLKQVVVQICDIYSTDHDHCMAFLPDWSDFLYNVYVEVLNNSGPVCTPEYPPCDGLTYDNYMLNIQTCYKYHNIPPGLGLHATPCPEGTVCEVHFKKCYDYSQNPPVLYMCYDGQVSYTGTCSNNVPTTLPPPGYTWEDEWETDCIYTPQGCELISIFYPACQ